MSQNETKPWEPVVQRAEALTNTQILKEAKRTIQNLGWAQGTYHMKGVEGERQGFCLIGAIRYAVWGTVNLDDVLPFPDLIKTDMTFAERSAVSMKLNGAVERVMPLVEGCIRQRPGSDRYFYNVAEFNDYEDTSRKDVLDVLNCAIERAMTEEANA